MALGGIEPADVTGVLVGGEWIATTSFATTDFAYGVPGFRVETADGAVVAGPFAELQAIRAERSA